MANELIVIDDNSADALEIEGIIRKWGGDYRIRTNDEVPAPKDDTDEAREEFYAAVCEFVRHNLNSDTEAILLDVVFSQGKGVEAPLGYVLGKRLRRQFREIPIIFFTVRGEAEDFRNATYFFNFDGYISKTEFKSWRSDEKFVYEIKKASEKRKEALAELEYFKGVDAESTPISSKQSPVIMHISDIHYGIEGAVSEINAYASTLNALQRDIADNYPREGIPKPNLVVVSGDITKKGALEGYGSAKTFLNELGKLLGIATEHILLVPGNHDVNRAFSRFACNLDPFDESITAEGKPFGGYYPYRFGPFKTFFDDFYDRKYVYSLETNHMFTIFDLRHSYDLVFVGLNSCEIVDHSEKRRGKGYISLDTVQALKRKLTIHGLGGREVRKIAIWHHPLLTPDTEDIDISHHQEVLSELTKDGFFAYLHGHIHKPFHNYSPETGNGIFQFGAGTIGATSVERPEDWPRQYEVLCFNYSEQSHKIYSRQRAGNNFIPFASFVDNKPTYDFTIPA